uniref:Uncharacterized protein n=1 Tax=Knipowitschia caucasica TaxID=637954 RepID=A0AAV2J7G1_KNICA
MIIIIGGIIVASVLVFIFILLMKYKLHSQHYKQKSAAHQTNVCSQTNGGGGGLPIPPPTSSTSGGGPRSSAAEGLDSSVRGTTVVDLNPGQEQDPLGALSGASRSSWSRDEAGTVCLQRTSLGFHTHSCTGGGTSSFSSWDLTERQAPDTS